MSAFQTGLTANKTAINTDWTTKTAPSSISPTDGGGNVEDLNQLIQDLGWDGDLLTLISTAFNLLVGTSGLTNTLITPTSVAVRSAGTVKRAEMTVSSGTGKVHLMDGSLSGSSKILSIEGTPFSGALTADRGLQPVDASGVIWTRVANADLLAQTAAVASLATYTPPTSTAGATTLNVSGYVNITTIGTAVLNFTVNFTDKNGVNRTVVLPASSVTSAAPIANMAAGDYYGVLNYPVRAKEGTAVTIAVVVVSGSGMTFDCGASITQLT